MNMLNLKNEFLWDRVYSMPIVQSCKESDGSRTMFHLTICLR
jgi:hypothetical protein